MYNLNRIEERCCELSDFMGDTFDIPIVLNGRLSRTLGQVIQQSNADGKWESTRMEFSKSFIASATDKCAEAVIDHEWAHYYATKTTGEPHGHDAVFKRICEMIGCTNDGIKTRVEYTQGAKSPFRYNIHCNDCGETIGQFARMCPTLRNIEDYHCKLCGSENLSVKQNW